jgi:Domain of unknown function (DUF4384)/Putative zinc-finger
MRSVARTEQCISNLRLDEWSAGELEADDAAEVEAHVATCEHCSARHAAFESLRAAYLQEVPSFDSARELHARNRQIEGPTLVLTKRAPLAGRRGLQIAAAFSSAALAAAAVLLMSAPDTDAVSGVRSKGGAHLDFFVKRGKHVERGVRGRALRPGDALRFTYSTAEDSYLAIFDLDAHAATVFFPTGERAQRVRAGSEVALDFSVELDDEPGDEWIQALFCRAPFDVEPVRASLEAKRGMSIPKGCQLDVISIAKVRDP